MTHTQFGLVGVATAAHVIQQANAWEEPIRIHHQQSGKFTVARHDSRVVFTDEACDTAIVLFGPGDIPFPSSALRMVPIGNWLKTGNDVGWLGFPSVAPQTLCFFSGRVSAWINDRKRYLIDGVSIHGVSGGPAFFVADSTLMVIGVMSEYHPNRAGGAALPGLCVVTDVTHFAKTVSEIKSMEEAREKEDESERTEGAEDEESAGGLL